MTFTESCPDDCRLCTLLNLMAGHGQCPECQRVLDEDPVGPPDGCPAWEAAWAEYDRLCAEEEESDQ